MAGLIYFSIVVARAPHIPYPILHDAAQVVAREYGIPAVPVLFQETLLYFCRRQSSVVLLTVPKIPSKLSAPTAPAICGAVERRFRVCRTCRINDARHTPNQRPHGFQVNIVTREAAWKAN